MPELLPTLRNIARHVALHQAQDLSKQLSLARSESSVARDAAAGMQVVVQRLERSLDAREREINLLQKRYDAAATQVSPHQSNWGW